ncbi:MAG: phosphatidate cytidylyltransferase [Actinomycetia bacterium]|nr:phosphatidate cytidylyltransferase [Actinomycetes bacterium]
MTYELKEEAPAGIHKAGFMTRSLTGAAFAIVWLAGVVLGLRWYALPILCAVVTGIGVHEFIQLRRGFAPGWLNVIVGFLYLAIPLACLIMIRALPVIGLGLAITLVFSIWGADTAAYVFGSLLGRHKLVPKISPKKSWEGFIASIIVSILVWVIAPRFFFTGGIWWWLAVIMGVIMALVGLGGDLFESHLKRRAGVKDAGTILPGHGGVLDRFDSLLAAAPVTLILISILSFARFLRS